jgi:hypothetical protein
MKERRKEEEVHTEGTEEEHRGRGVGQEWPT